MTDYIKRKDAIKAVIADAKLKNLLTGNCENEKAIEDMVYGVLCPRDIPSADVVEVVRCRDCIHYDPPHIENNGERYEYKDMPKDAFDELGTGLVHAGYGVNIGGRCTKNYNAGYACDKRVYMSANSFCSYGERTEA